jgi:hypothetical protein
VPGWTRVQIADERLCNNLTLMHYLDEDTGEMEPWCMNAFYNVDGWDVEAVPG